MKKRNQKKKVKRKKGSRNFLSLLANQPHNAILGISGHRFSFAGKKKKKSARKPAKTSKK